MGLYNKNRLEHKNTQKKNKMQKEDDDLLEVIWYICVAERGRPGIQELCARGQQGGEKGWFCVVAAEQKRENSPEVQLQIYEQ